MPACNSWRPKSDLSRERLIQLYKELKGVSPPKGLAAFFDRLVHDLAGQYPFVDVLQHVPIHAGLRPTRSRLQALIKSYRLYLEQIEYQGGEIVLDFTRAYTMVRFFDSDMLQLSSCSRCGGHFVAHAHDHKTRLRVRAVPPAVARRQGARRPSVRRARPVRGRIAAAALAFRLSIRR